MVIPGLNNPFTLEVGTMSIVTETKRLRMVIGRDVLKQYTLIYDPPHKDYRLELPTSGLHSGAAGLPQGRMQHP